MDGIYRDAYPDVFATFEDDYESVNQSAEDFDNDGKGFLSNIKDLVQTNPPADTKSPLTQADISFRDIPVIS